MNSLKYVYLLLFFGLVLNSCSHKPKKEITTQAGVIPVIKNYDYKKLQLREYDDMLALVRSRINKAEEITLQAQEEGTERQAEGKTLILLKNAMTLILTRPNASNDNLVAKLSPVVRSELNNYEAYYRTMDVIVSAALNNLIRPNVTVNYKVGSTFILDNAMSELKPELKSDPKVKKIFEKIRDAQIIFDRKISSQRLLQAMASSSSPSEVAKNILEKTFPDEVKKGFFSRLFGN